MSKQPSPQQPDDLTPGPAAEGETQSAPTVAPTPQEVGSKASAHGAERGVNPRAGEESRNLHEAAASLDGPPAAEADATGAAPRDPAKREFPVDPKTGGLPADHVRDAGPEEMANPPREWDEVDEEGDESFPASDPPGNY